MTYPKPLTRDELSAYDPRQNGYDYTNQAWVINGRYYPCGHVGTQWPCDCFGRKHAGETIKDNADVR